MRELFLLIKCIALFCIFAVSTFAGPVDDCFKEKINKKVIVGAFGSAAVLHLGGSAVVDQWQKLKKEKNVETVLAPTPIPQVDRNDDEVEFDFEETPNPADLAKTQEEDLDDEKEIEKAFSPKAKIDTSPAKVRSQKELTQVFHSLDAEYQKTGVRPKKLNAKLVFEAEVSAYNEARLKNPKLGLPISNAQYKNFLNDWDKRVESYTSHLNDFGQTNDQKLQNIFTDFFDQKISEYMENRAMSIHCLMIADCNCKGKAIAAYALALDLEDKASLTPDDGKKLGFFYPKAHIEPVFYKPPIEKQKPFSEIEIWKMIRGDTDKPNLSTTSKGALYDAAILPLMFEAIQNQSHYLPQKQLDEMKKHWVAGNPMGKNYDREQKEILKNLKDWRSYETAFLDPPADPSLIVFEKKEDQEKDPEMISEKRGAAKKNQSQNTRDENKGALLEQASLDSPLNFSVKDGHFYTADKSLLQKQVGVSEEQRKKIFRDSYFESIESFLSDKRETMLDLTLKMQNQQSFLKNTTEVDAAQISELNTNLNKIFDMKVLEALYSEDERTTVTKKIIKSNPEIENFLVAERDFTKRVSENPKTLMKVLTKAPQQGKQMHLLRALDSVLEPGFHQADLGDYHPEPGFYWDQNTYYLQPRNQTKGKSKNLSAGAQDSDFELKSNGGVTQIDLTVDEKNAVLVDAEGFRSLLQNCHSNWKVQGNSTSSSFYLLCAPVFRGFNKTFAQNQLKACRFGSKASDCLLPKMAEIQVLSGNSVRTSTNYGLVKKFLDYQERFHENPVPIRAPVSNSNDMIPAEEAKLIVGLVRNWRAGLKKKGWALNAETYKKLSALYPNHPVVPLLFSCTSSKYDGDLDACWDNYTRYVEERLQGKSDKDLKDLLPQ